MTNPFGLDMVITSLPSCIAPDGAAWVLGTPAALHWTKPVASKAAMRAKIAKRELMALEAWRGIILWSTPLYAHLDGARQSLLT